MYPDHSPSAKRKCRKKIRPKPAGPSVTRAAAHAHSMIKKHATDPVTPVTPVSASVSDREGELTDLEKIMDSFDSEPNVIGTIIKCDIEGSHGVSDSPQRITLGTSDAA